MGLPRLVRHVQEPPRFAPGFFGSDHLVYFALACFVAYAFSGHTGIYGSQRVAVPKPGQLPKHLTLSELRQAQNRFVWWLRRKQRT